MKFPRSALTQTSNQPTTEQSMTDFAAQERRPVLERVKRDRARNEQQLRGLAGDEEVDRMKSYGALR